MGVTFSVILAAYNASRYVGEALASLREQACDDYELIVVDDGSSDGTAEVVRRAAPGARVLHHERNRGLGAARNTGIAEASGRYVCFLDSDDLWVPWTLEAYRVAIERVQGERGQAPAFLVGSANIFEEHPAPVEALDPGGREPTLRVFPSLLDAAGEDIWVASPVMVLDRELLAEVGGFTTERVNLVDRELALRVADRGPFVHVADPPVVRYRVHAQSMSRGYGKSRRAVLRLMALERAGELPGGPQRRAERERLIALSARTYSVGAARRGHAAMSMELYLRSLPMQVRQRRWAYLAGLPGVLAAGIWRRTLGRTRVQGPVARS